MLRRRQPVVWVENLNNMFLFVDKSVFKVTTAWCDARRLTDYTLVLLYDATAGAIPRSLWGSGHTLRPHYIVLATSPDVPIFQPWMELSNHCMTMKYFTRNEVAWLQYVQRSCHLTDSPQARQDGLPEVRPLS
jgi:hypothetical protein